MRGCIEMGGHTFELLRGLRIVFVLIGVVLQGRLAVGLLDFVLSGVGLDAQGIV
jgi:hypothetical protein